MSYDEFSELYKTWEDEENNSLSFARFEQTSAGKYNIRCKNNRKQCSEFIPELSAF